MFGRSEVSRPSEYEDALSHLKKMQPFGAAFFLAAKGRGYGLKNQNKPKSRKRPAVWALSAVCSDKRIRPSENRRLKGLLCRFSDGLCGDRLCLSDEIVFNILNLIKKFLFYEYDDGQEYPSYSFQL